MTLCTKAGQSPGLHLYLHLDHLDLTKQNDLPFSLGRDQFPLAVNFPFSPSLHAFS